MSGWGENPASWARLNALFFKQQVTTKEDTSMSMTSEGLRPRRVATVQRMSVREMCDEIREAPAYDAEAGITREQLAKAYERLRRVSVELVEWLEGTDTDGGTESPAPCGEEGRSHE